MVIVTVYGKVTKSDKIVAKNGKTVYAVKIMSGKKEKNGEYVNTFFTAYLPFDIAKDTRVVINGELSVTITDKYTNLKILNPIVTSVDFNKASDNKLTETADHTVLAELDNDEIPPF